MTFPRRYKLYARVTLLVVLIVFVPVFCFLFLSCSSPSRRVEAPAPKPAPFPKPVSSLDDEEDSVVFEDATLGVEAAKRANMRCVGIDRDNHPDLFKKADIVVKDLGEIDLIRLQSLFS